MRRTPAVIVLLLGIVLLVGSVTHILPAGTTSLGSSTLLCGLLLLGLSFVPRSAADPHAPPALASASRIIGVFYQPAGVFQNLRAHPRWAAAFLVIAVCLAIYQFAFTTRVTPEAIAAAMIDRTVAGGLIPEDQAERLRERQMDAARLPMARVSGVVSGVVVFFFFLALVAALYLLGVTMFGGRINFWQSLSVVAYAWLPPAVIQYLLSLMLLYLKSPDDIDLLKGQQGLVQDNLSILVSSSAHPVLHTAASFIGVLSFYKLWLTATGLHNTGERVSVTTAWIIALTLWVIGLGLAVALATLFPSFV